MLNQIKQHPTHLLVGPSPTTTPHVIHTVHQALCIQDICDPCLVQTQIKQKQHPHVIWLVPQDTYTKDQIEIIFDNVRFARDPDDLFFFIIEKADLLNPASANKLLKLLEEPPAGYHFILLAETIDRILSTIRSRCLITYIGQQEPSVAHELVNLFVQKTDPLTWLTTLEASQLTPQECLLIINQALKQCIQEFETTGNANLEKRIATLTKALEYPPMPGSAKIYLKNIFLQLL